MPTKIELDDIQGIILRGYGVMESAQFLLLHFEDTQGAKTWLKTLAGQITNAEVETKELDHCVNIAFTNSGVIKLGLAPEILNTFSREFEEGMVTEHRQRMFGDFGESDPQNWEWGYTTAPNDPDHPENIHAVLLLYARNDSDLTKLVTHHQDAMRASKVKVLKALSTQLLPGRKEHFGFRDGIAQPVVKGTGWDMGKQHPANELNPGEFLFGYQNEYDKYTLSPNVSPQLDQNNRLQPDKNNPERKDLGRNGSMLVFRQMSQDVKAFWEAMDKAVKTQQVPNTADNMEKMGAKMVGRWPSGAPLTKCPVHDNPKYQDFDNFGYAEKDYDGFACPIGSHIRRTNPRDNFLRDSTGKPEKDIANSQKFMKRFRILRRGRAYGNPIASSMLPVDMLSTSDPGGERGLHFLCFQSNIGRQFELIQQTWVNNPKFAGLYEDPDPIIGYPEVMGEGATTTFTEQAQPIRKKVTGLPRFVNIKGGAYFFMPGIKGIQFLGEFDPNLS